MHDRPFFMARSLFNTLNPHIDVPKMFIHYLDDLCHKFPSSMERFQQSVLSSESVDEAVLDKFRANLCGMYHLWDTIPANCIASSAMDFISGSLLEGLQGKIAVSPGAHSWPYYLREKTGVATAYAFMIFPQDPSYNVMDFIQVIGDIAIYINLVNDVLSFYKEELAHDTGNYVHNRALVNGKSTHDTLGDIVGETVAAYSRVCNVLQASPASNERWKIFAYGYMSVSSYAAWTSLICPRADPATLTSRDIVSTNSGSYRTAVTARLSIRCASWIVE
ncbi:hypothetical protein DXG01_010007 [Tephrocybe rancida]|nr:hypothetical protein DXG01_010007 [Tephrocybe rancida]